jgi:transposase
VAAELVSDLECIHQRKKAADRELRELLKATDTSLMDLNGIGPSGAALLLIRGWRHHPVPLQSPLRVAERHTPIDASSGERVRHRLSRAGNRQINRVLHIMAVVQLRHRASEGKRFSARSLCPWAAWVGPAGW